MIKFLPFILIPILILGGLLYWRYSASTQQNLAAPTASEQPSTAPVEVPKTLPGASLEDRVKSLEDTVNKLATQVNNSTSSNSKTTSNQQDSTDVQAAITELKARVSALEKATPVPAAAAGQSTVYIPLGAGGSWSDLDWHSLPEYEVTLNPDNYPGYTGMYLEVNFRMVESAGVASVRLYNVTNGSVTSSQLDTTSTSFGVQTSSAFKLATGTKTYRLQVKSTQNKDVLIQSARIKVSF